uniref:Conserved secreted protein n=1 Tax=Steinernema glaseri TaxID=37863 RepID=A0A1I7Y9C0_9BILA
MRSLIVLLAVSFFIADAQFYYYYPVQYYVPTYYTTGVTSAVQTGAQPQSQHEQPQQAQYSPNYANGNQATSSSYYPQQYQNGQQMPQNNEQVYRDQTKGQQAVQAVQPLYYYTYPYYYVLGK